MYALQSYAAERRSSGLNIDSASAFSTGPLPQENDTSDIIVNGNVVRSFSSSNKTSINRTENDQTLYTKTDLPEATHTVRVANLGPTQPQETGMFMMVDSVVIENTQGEVRFLQNHQQTDSTSSSSLSYSSFSTFADPSSSPIASHQSSDDLMSIKEDTSTSTSNSGAKGSSIEDNKASAATSSAPTKEKDNGNDGQALGIGVGIVCAAIALIAMGLIIYYKKRRSSKTPDQESDWYTCAPPTISTVDTKSWMSGDSTL